MNRFKNMHKTQRCHRQTVGRRPSPSSVEYRLKARDTRALKEALEAVLYIPVWKKCQKPTTTETR